MKHCQELIMLKYQLKLNEALEFWSEQNHSPKAFLTTLHITIIEPYFPCWNTIWGQYGVNAKNLLLNRLHTLQNKAARIVAGMSYEEADHTKLLQELDWLNVRKGICYDVGISMFKIKKSDAPEAILEMFRHNDYSYYTRSVASDNFSVNMGHLSIEKTAISYIGLKNMEQYTLINQSESLESFRHERLSYANRDIVLVWFFTYQTLS